MIITVMTKLYLMLDICQNFKSFIAFNFHCNQMKLIRVSHPQRYWHFGPDKSLLGVGKGDSLMH